MTRLVAWMLAACLTGGALAQDGGGGDGLDALLIAVHDHPAVRAARASFASAEASRDATYDSVALDLSGGYSAFDNEEVDLDPTLPGDQSPPGSAGQASAELTVRPFPFGPLADQVDQREVQLRQARLQYLETLASYQVQAVEAAHRVRMAEGSLEVAREGAELAAASLEATRLRFENGAANARELRDAETNLLEAENFVADAEASRGLARAHLRSLVGSVSVPTTFDVEVPPPEAAPTDVRRARFEVELAEVGSRRPQREVLPVVNASYSRNLDDHSSVSVSLETRTLQPSVRYSYQEPGRSGAQSVRQGSFQIGVSWTISLGAFDALEAVERRHIAARDGLEAARAGADVRRARLENALAQAERQRDLAERRYQNARTTLVETERREELGLAVPLETQEASLQVTQRELDLRDARQAVLEATLEFYTFYARPMSNDPVPEAPR